MNKITQDKRVLDYLKEHKSINPMQSLGELGCYRLSARIKQLRNQGYSIITKRITKEGKFGKVNFAEYHLEQGGANG
jgi:hypothetical protein